MVLNGSKNKAWKKTCSPRLIFPVSVLALYLVLWKIAPENTLVALGCSIGILFHVFPPLCLVFLLMVGLNIFLKPTRVAEYLGKDTTIREKLLSAVAGIISAGPIYVWYPILKDLREKGIKNALIAIFLVNRAVKPFLLPVMISFLGWAYVLILMLSTVAGSCLVGSVIGALLDHPSNATNLVICPGKNITPLILTEKRNGDIPAKN